MQNTIDINTINTEYKTGIFFSILESLKEDQTIKFVTDAPPDELEQVLLDSKIKNIKWAVNKGKNNTWELYIQKLNSETTQDTEQNVGCCGMCGLHGSNENKG